MKKKIALFFAGIGSVLALLGLFLTGAPWWFIANPRLWLTYPAWWPTFAPGVYEILADWGSTESLVALLFVIPSILVIVSIIGVTLTEGAFNRLCWTAGTITAALLFLYCIVGWWFDVTGGLPGSGQARGLSAASPGLYLSLFGNGLALFGLLGCRLVKE